MFKIPFELTSDDRQTNKIVEIKAGVMPVCLIRRRTVDCRTTCEAPEKVEKSGAESYCHEILWFHLSFPILRMEYYWH